MPNPSQRADGARRDRRAATKVPTLAIAAASEPVSASAAWATTNAG